MIYAEILPAPLLETADPERRAVGRRPTGRLPVRPISRLWFVAGLVASLALPVFAQDGTGPMPENAQPRSYGSGWVCDVGYRVEGAECLAFDIPEHAYLTEDSSGTGWTCDRGYAAVARTCMPIAVPANAFLDQASHGPVWSCKRGYEPLSGACVTIDLPENAYIDRSGNRWSCNRGFQLSDGACILGR